MVADYINMEFDVGVRLADEFLLRAGDVAAAARAADGDRTVTGTVWNVHRDDGDRRRRGGSTATRFRVHEIAQSSAFVASVRPRRPFDVSTARWRRPAPGAADAGAASCDMSPSKLLPAEDTDDDDSDEVDPDSDEVRVQKVKAVIQERAASDESFQYYIMSAESPPYFRFTIPGGFKPHIDNIEMF